jgi:hypothetical protein
MTRTNGSLVVFRDRAVDAGHDVLLQSLYTMRSERLLYGRDRLQRRADNSNSLRM